MFEFKCTYWFSELDNRPYYNCILKKDGKIVFHIPNSVKPITKENMISMYEYRRY